MKKFQFKIHGNEYEVEIKNFENDIAEIEVNGTAYKVEVDKKFQKPKTPTIISKAATPQKAADTIKKTSSGITLSKVIAPLPGDIISIDVKQGDNVNVGDRILVMEAMKMENNVLAEKTGTVKEIKVSVGDSVLQGDILIEIV